MKTNTTNKEPKAIRRTSTTDRSDVVFYENIYYAVKDIVPDDSNTSFVLTSVAIALSINSGTEFMGYHFEELNENYDDLMKRYYELG